MKIWRSVASRYGDDDRDDDACGDDASDET